LTFVQSDVEWGDFKTSREIQAYMTRSVALLVSLVVLFLMAGCGGGSAAPAPAAVNISGTWSVVTTGINLMGSPNSLGFGLNIQQNGNQITAASAPYVDQSGISILPDEVAAGTLSGSNLTLTITDPSTTPDAGSGCVFNVTATASSTGINGNYLISATPNNWCYIFSGTIAMTPQYAVQSSPLVSGENPAGLTTVNMKANDLAWDPTYGKIYLSVPSTASSNANSIQSLDPVSGNLGPPVPVGSGPNLLAVSSSSQYLYIGLDGASSVKRVTLPGLGSDIQFELGEDPYNDPYYATDIEATRNADGTVAVVRSTVGAVWGGGGGVVIYDNSVARPDVLCGWDETGCPRVSGAYDSIQWNSDGSQMFVAGRDDFNDDFYTIPVSSSGFGQIIGYGGLAELIGPELYYDPTTKYVYDDIGSVIDPSQGTMVGNFNASGLMVPDGSLGKAFFLGQVSNADINTYFVESFDIQKFTPIAILAMHNVSGTPTHLIRWGSNGLAFTTSDFVYIYSGSFVNSSVATASAEPIPRENVQRTWKLVRPQPKTPSTGQ
jgi:hypothetical protein